MYQLLPQYNDLFDPLYCLSYKLIWCWSLDAPCGLNKHFGSIFRDVDGKPPITQPEL
jgi:hypothetical protein